jgi:ribonucleoside-diphosphate reductase alpha chain
MSERERLEDERDGLTHHFRIMSAEGERKFYVTTGHYQDGRLGELFITAGKEGSFANATLDALATVMSIGLQYGIPLEVFTRKLRHISCEPAGMVFGAPEQLAGVEGQKFIAKSPLDYLSRWLEWRYPDGVLRPLPRPR